MVLSYHCSACFNFCFQCRSIYLIFQSLLGFSACSYVSSVLSDTTCLASEWGFVLSQLLLPKASWIIWFLFWDCWWPAVPAVVWDILVLNILCFSLVLQMFTFPCYDGILDLWFYQKEKSLCNLFTVNFVLVHVLVLSYEFLKNVFTSFTSFTLLHHGFHGIMLLAEDQIGKIAQLWLIQLCILLSVKFCDKFFSLIREKCTFSSTFGYKAQINSF